MEAIPQIIGIPHGTRLYYIVLHKDECHVWIAVKNTHKQYNKWQGTYICMQPNGRVVRITKDDANVDDYREFVIKEK